MAHPKHNTRRGFLLWALPAAALAAAYALYLVQSGQLQNPNQKAGPPRHVQSPAPQPAEPERSLSQEPPPQPAEPTPDDLADDLAPYPTPPDDSPEPPPASPAPTPAEAPSPDPGRSAEPTPIPLETLARNPELLPASVRLLAPLAFPVLIAGKPAGSVMLPAGSSVAVAGADADGLTLRHGEATARATFDLTDFEERVRAAEARGDASGEAPSSSPEPAPEQFSPEPTPWWMRAEPGKPVPVPVSTAAAVGGGEKGRHLSVEVIPRKRRERDELTGQQLESLRFRLKISNADINHPAEGLQVTLWAFAEYRGGKGRHHYRLLGSQSFPATIPPRESLELNSRNLAAEKKDPKGLGLEFGGWALVIRDGSGDLLLCKASQAGFENPERLDALSGESAVGRKLEPIPSGLEE